MATLFQPLWYCGARDVLGAAVATGKAYFYVVGSTSECVDVWEDAGETTPITHDPTHPITLDAGGRAKVYLKDPAKVVITDAAGVVKQTIAEGTAVDAGLVTATWNSTAGTGIGTVTDDIEDSLGLKALYKESSETGVVQRTYHDVVRQFISPYDFDATGDGSADDTAELQAAIDRAIATGLPLNLETGTYKITSGLVGAGALVGIYGAGASKAIITTTATALTGLSVVMSGGYLRDFAVHLPYGGTTYDTAVSITGSTCAVERLDVTGGQGIVSTAPHTRVVDCVVNFKCPNTGAAYGSGIDLGVNSVAENCSVNGQVGDSASYLTRGIYLQLAGAESTSVAIGCRVANCYVGGEGGVYVRTEFDTCTTGIKCLGQRTGGIACRMTACTTPLNGLSADYPLNIGNHFDGSLQTIEADTSYQTSDSDTPTFIVYPQCRTHIFRCTYNGTVSMVTVNLAQAVGSWGIGAKTSITVQTNATAQITAFTWHADMLKYSEPTVADATAVYSEWVKGTAKLAQVVDWTTMSGDIF